MSDLPKRTLGRTGLEVTALGFGAMELRGSPRGRPITPEAADAVLNGALDAGINYVDTSIDYGVSEEFIGQFISHRRSEYYLASKCGCVVGEAAAERGERIGHIFTKENVQAGIEQSLKRLKTDCIDVMQFHTSPSKEALEEEDLIDLLGKFKEQGKIRFIGISATLPHIRDHVKMGVFDVFQIPYSALERDHEELITLAAQAGAGTVIRGGVAKGAPSPDKQSGDRWAAWQRSGLDLLLNEGVSRMELMLRFTLSHPGLSTTIVGTMNPQHLKDNVTIAEKGPLPLALYEEAKRKLSATGFVPERHS